jgi:hypothetical protein
VDCKNKSDTINTRGNWNLKIMQKMPKEHTGKARHQGTTNNSNIEHHTQSLESSNAKVQKIQHGK